MESQKTTKNKSPVLLYLYYNDVLNCGHEGGLSRIIGEIRSARLNPSPDDYRRILNYEESTPFELKIDRDQDKYRHENDNDDKWGCTTCADEYECSIPFATLGI